MVVAEQVNVAPSGLALPVMGVRADQLTDTFMPRVRLARHDAIDIMAPEGTPVMAAAEGPSRSVQQRSRRNDDLRAVTGPEVGILLCPSPRYAPGLHEGQQVKRGQVIARVGHTGDAAPQARISILQSTRWALATVVERYAHQSLPAACREKGQRLEAGSSAGHGSGGPALFIQFNRQGDP